MQTTMSYETAMAAQTAVERLKANRDQTSMASLALRDTVEAKPVDERTNADYMAFYEMAERASWANHYADDGETAFRRGRYETLFCILKRAGLTLD